DADAAVSATAAVLGATWHPERRTVHRGAVRAVRPRVLAQGRYAAAVRRRVARDNDRRYIRAVRVQAVPGPALAPAPRIIVADAVEHAVRRQRFQRPSYA